MRNKGQHHAMQDRYAYDEGEGGRPVRFFFRNERAQGYTNQEKQACKRSQVSVIVIGFLENFEKNFLIGSIWPIQGHSRCKRGRGPRESSPCFFNAFQRSPA